MAPEVVFVIVIVILHSFGAATILTGIVLLCDLDWQGVLDLTVITPNFLIQIF